jgi:hypothetical protein
LPAFSFRHIALFDIFAISPTLSSLLLKLMLTPIFSAQLFRYFSEKKDIRADRYAFTPITPPFTPAPLAPDTQRRAER